MPRIDLFGIEIRGTGTVSMEFNVSGGSRERAEICIGQKLLPGLGPGESRMLLTTVLYCQISRYKSCTLPRGVDAVSFKKARPPPKSMPIVYIAHVVGGAPLRQPTIK